METAVREAFLGEQIDLSSDEHRATVTKGMDSIVYVWSSRYHF